MFQEDLQTEPVGEGTNEQQNTPPPSYREIAMMEQGPADEILLRQDDLAVLRTNYWEITTDDRKGRWYNPRGQPKNEKLTVMIRKCVGKGCLTEDHTHDTTDGASFKFKFEENPDDQQTEESKWWLNEYRKTQEPDYEVIVAEPHIMVFTTHYYRTEQVRNQEVLTFNPGGPRQPERRPVGIRGCYDFECPRAATHYSHDTADGSIATYNPLDQTIGNIPARLKTLDDEEEWKEIRLEEVEEADNTESEESEEETKFRVVKLTRNWVKLVTNY